MTPEKIVGASIVVARDTSTLPEVAHGTGSQPAATSHIQVISPTQIANAFQVRQHLAPVTLEDIISQVGNIPDRYSNYLDTPNYNSYYHTEGGPNGTLRNHLNEIVSAYNRIKNGEGCGLEEEVFETVQRVILENSEAIETFIALHDVGKATTIKRYENGDHTYPNHEEESYQVLVNNNVTYNNKPIDDLMKLIIRHHIFAFKVEYASHLTDLFDFRKDYISLVEKADLSSSLIYKDKEAYYKALEMLIATTALDLLGSKGPKASFEPINNLVLAYKNLKAIQELLSEFDEIKINEKSKTVDTKALSALLKSKKPLIVNGEESAELKAARKTIDSIVNPPKQLLDDAKVDLLRERLTTAGFQNAFNALRTITSIEEARIRLTRILAKDTAAATKIDAIINILEEVSKPVSVQ